MLMIGWLDLGRSKYGAANEDPRSQPRERAVDLRRTVECVGQASKGRRVVRSDRVVAALALAFRSNALARRPLSIDLLVAYRGPIAFGRSPMEGRNSAAAHPPTSMTSEAAALTGNAAESHPAPTSDATLRDLYRQMWIHAAGARGWLALSSVMLIASQLIKLLVPWFAARAVDALARATGGHGSLAECLPWVAGIVAASVGCWLLHGPGRIIERSVALRVRRSLTDRLYARLSGAPLAWHEKQHSVELAHRVTQSSEALVSFTQSQFMYLQSAVNLVGPLVALALLSSLIGGLTLVGVFAISLTIVSFDRALMRLARQENDANRRHSAALVDCLSNVATVMCLRLQEATRRLLSRRLEASVEPVKRSISLNEWKWCAVDLLSVGLSWVLVVVYVWRSNSEGILVLGSVIMVYQYTQQAGGVIGSLASNLQSFARMRTDFASAAPIWAAPQCRPEAFAKRDWRCIDLCNLSFEHDVASDDPGVRRGGVRNVSMRLHAGERIALVGPSGSGKSTLLRLLAALYAPTGGHIEVDGVATLSGRGLGSVAMLIPQDAQVFETSVRENVEVDSGADEEALRWAARTSMFDSVLATLPLGWDTPVVQGGFNLSGGQRQRLCLARGVLAARGSSVLLLDEPTSALDPMTEGVVYERLMASFPRACVIASVHRMALLEHFDRVALMQDGHLLDVGTQEELLARQPLFKTLLEAQSAPGAQGASRAGSR